ncbi:hypothetical protein JTE90_002169 [Oedothorax gibbosus]|uniref:Elongation of very long chain fatty acids protein n=1 Tax=Oedothorax gibbosus TaxID=931172 RepID=A0AAV6V6Z5_9ARAC|nr:hypothetical protein JTE90_002169 [Oedothorax gibbosus]
MVPYPFMDNVKPTLVFTLMYLICVLYLGPMWMKNRKPFVLRTPLLIYNLSMVSASCWLLANMTRACWWLYISKLVEYCDTFFFVLRKKGRQINFLHVFHHASVPITAWFGVNYGPSGFSMIFPTVNCFVHIWMYLYYGLSALGPEMQKYLCWKKYLTSLQLMQFLFVIIYFLQLYIFPKEGCEVSPFLFFLSTGQAVLYLVLFANFYLKLYSKGTHKYTINCVKTSDCIANGQRTMPKKKEN